MTDSSNRHYRLPQQLGGGFVNTVEAGAVTADLAGKTWYRVAVPGVDHHVLVPGEVLELVAPDEPALGSVVYCRSGARPAVFYQHVAGVADRCWRSFQGELLSWGQLNERYDRVSLLLDAGIPVTGSQEFIIGWLKLNVESTGRYYITDPYGTDYTDDVFLNPSVTEMLAVHILSRSVFG